MEVVRNIKNEEDEVVLFIKILVSIFCRVSFLEPQLREAYL